MDFELIVVKRCVRGALKSDARYLARFEGDECTYLSKIKH